MKTENWKRIENIDGNYMISDYGNMVNVRTGKRVGSIAPDGYVHFLGKLNGKVKNFKIHQLVWDAFGGGNYDGRNIVIDHKNGIRSDNRIENLQLLKFRDNCNKDIKVGRSGVMGVSWCTSKQRWLAQISIEDKRHKLGYRKTIEEAKALYDNALSIYEDNGMTPDDMRLKLPDEFRKCTECGKVLEITEFDNYKTCRGNVSPRAKCRTCYKEYRKLHDKKYRNKGDQTFLGPPAGAGTFTRQFKRYQYLIKDNRRLN